MDGGTSGRIMGVKRVIGFVQTCGRITSTWPSGPGISRNRQNLVDVFWWLSLVNVILLLVPLILGVHHYRNDIVLLMKALSTLTALSEVFFNLVICRLQRSRFQALLYEMIYRVESTRDCRVYQKYVDRYLPFLMILGGSFFLTAVVFSCIPLVMKTDLPAEAWYPFSIESGAVRFGLYLNQVLAIFQTGLCITVDVMVAAMLWYSSARVEMLANKVKNVTNEVQLGECIVEHQRIIAFARETNFAVRFLVLKGNATMALAVICGAVPLITHQPVLVTSQFILFVGCGLLRLYATAWPADDLVETSQKLSNVVYGIRWFEASPKIRSAVLFVVQRSQKPLAISVTGILPALTLPFYASFVSGTASYFVTLRAMIGE